MGRRSKIIICVLASAGLCALSWPGFLSPFLLFISFIPALTAFRRLHPWQGFVWGCLHGAVMYGVGGYWVIVSIHMVFGISFPLSVLIFVIMLFLFYSIPSGLFAAVVSCSGYVEHWWQRVVLLAAGFILWAGIEYTRGVVFPGFNVMTLASCFYGYPAMLSPVSSIGQHGYSVLVLLINASLLVLGRQVWAAWKMEKYHPLLQGSAITSIMLLVAVAGLFVGSRAAGYGGSSDPPPMASRSVLLVQPLIPAEEKWEKKHIRSNLERCIRVTRDGLNSATRMVIWPETALQFYLQQDSSYSQRVLSFTRDAGIMLLAGGPEFVKSGNETRYYNSIYLVDEDGARSIYRKERLIPFAEYCPVSLFQPFFEKMLGKNEYSTGAENSGLNAGDARITFAICFESLFPGLMSDRSSNSDLVVIISDDAWLGTTHGALQHLAGTVPAAVENGTWILFCVNSGISAVIGPGGTIRNSLPFGVEGTVAFPEK